MHPVLARKERLLTFYLLLWVPLATLLTRLLTLSGDLTWRQAAALAVPLCAFYAFISLSGWYMCRFMPLRETPAAKLLLANVGAAAFSSGLWVALGYGIARVESLGDNYVRHAQLLFGIGLLLYLLADAVYYVLLTLESWRQAEAREAEARLLARDAELRALKSQVNPHFLFNSLHSISALTTADPARAREMCVLLAEFLRSTLGLGERERVPLDEELALVRRYLAVEKVRFGPRLEVREAIEDDSKQCLVPPLLLQPLVENAINHGIAPLVAGGSILLDARRADGNVRISVENTFDSEGPPRRRGGRGLVNVRKRLDACYGPAARLDIRVAENRYRVELLIPALQEAKS